MGTLPVAKVTQWKHDGFLSPFPLLDAEELKACQQGVARYEAWLGAPIDEGTPVAMPLNPGWFSMHHGLCPHRSGPNTSSHRRIGLGFNYIPTHARPAGTIRQAALLVRGTDRYGHFETAAWPTQELG